MIITRIRRRLTGSPDAGFSLVEVIVALGVFAVIALGMAYSLTTMQTLSKDSVLRETAIGIANTELDSIRATADPATLSSSVTPTSVTAANGVVYTIDRHVEWVPASGTIAACGTGGGNLLYKSVALTVTWAGMSGNVKPVLANTNLSPADRVNDPTLGTIVVAVRGADGLGRSGVTVTITNKATGVALGSVPATDVDGCSYVLKVPPATYVVKLTKTGYITSEKMIVSSTTGPTVERTVDAGTTASAALDFDAALTVNRTYASNKPGAVVMPSNLDTTFFYSGGAYVANDAGVLPTTSSVPISLFPYPDGYTVAAGKVQAQTATTDSCLSPDPAAWGAGAVSGQNKANGVRPDPVSGDPGTSASTPIPMGYANVTFTALTTSIRAVSTTAGYPGDPGCINTMTYNFNTSSSLLGGKATLALPYGSWKLTGYTTALAIVPLTTVTVPAGTGAAASGQVVTLDPRANL